MKSILERLKEDPELDKFYDLNDVEQKDFLNEILLFSNDNQQEIKDLCLKTTPDFFSIHSIIFEALSEDWEKWGGFLTDEFIRIYKNAKKESNTIDYCDCLSSICFPETDKVYTKKVIDYIIKDIDNSSDILIQNLLNQLQYLITEDNFTVNRNSIEKIKLKINHPNWKIRISTYEFLSYFEQIPKEEYKLKIADRLKKNFSFIFGSSVIKENESPENKTLNFKWLTYVYLSLGIYFLLFQTPYKIIYTIIIAVPLIELLISSLLGKPSLLSIVKINKKNDETEASLGDFLNYTLLLVLIRLTFDFEIEHYLNMLKPLVIISSICLVIVYLSKQFITDFRIFNIMNLGILLNTIIYSVVLTFGVNCIYDSSIPEEFGAKVIGKHYEHHRKGSDIYELKVKPWGHSYHLSNISVSEKKYNEAKIGQSIKIDLKKGYLDIPWYYVE